LGPASLIVAATAIVDVPTAESDCLAKRGCSGLRANRTEPVSLCLNRLFSALRLLARFILQPGESSCTCQVWPQLLNENEGKKVTAFHVITPVSLGTV